MSGPLAGVRVLEFSQVIAAPFGGQFLAELGARVTKVEPPEGESWRLQLAIAPTESRSFQNLNRGKEDLTLRLDVPESRDIVRRLVAVSDIVIINYRPDVPAKFGVDYESLRALKPDLIYMDLTAFGRRGPWAARPGYDGVVQAVTGLMAGEAKLRDDGSPATVSSTAIADYGTGMVLADAAIAALYHRERTGEGQLVECSLFATALNLQGEAIMEHSLADTARNRARDARHERSRAGASFDELVRQRSEGIAVEPRYVGAWLARDGAVALSADTPAQRTAFDELFQEADVEALARRIGKHDVQYWIECCVELGIPCAPVQFPPELLSDDQVRDNAMLVDLEHAVTGPQTVPRTPLHFSGSPLPRPRAAPPLGRDTDVILREIGYSDVEIDAMREAGGIVT